MPDDRAALANQSAEALQGDVTREYSVEELMSGTDSAPNDADLESYQLELQKAELARLTQMSTLRSKFFWLATILAAAVILASTAGVGYYVIVSGKDTEPAVLITWMTAVVVELLGILKIMALYLFPNGNSKNSSDS